LFVSNHHLLGPTAEDAADDGAEPDDDKDDEDFVDSKEDNDNDEEEEQEDEPVEEHQPPPDISEMAGKKAAAVGKQPRKKAAPKEDPDESIEDITEALKDTNISSGNNSVDIMQHDNLLTLADKTSLRALFVTIQGLAPGDTGALGRVKNLKLLPNKITFDHTKDPSELDAKVVMKEIYNVKANHVAIANLQTQLFKHQHPHKFSVDLDLEINPKVAIDAHGRRSQAIRPHVTGRTKCPALTFILVAKHQKEIEAELEVKGVEATHSSDSMDGEDESPKNKRTRHAAAAAARSGLFGFGVMGL